MEIIGGNLERNLPQIRVQDKDHPIYDFQEDQIITVEGDDHTFWVAKILAVKSEKEKLKLQYYEGITFFSKINNIESDKQKWKIISARGSCHYSAVLTKYKKKEDLFTSQNKIRKTELKKIQYRLINRK